MHAPHSSALKFTPEVKLQSPNTICLGSVLVP